MPMDFFSHLEMPSLCLRDVKRTKAFRSAIESAVKPGDVVLDAGAGSGILAFFAAAAGAGKVYAVEGNEALANRLRANVELNGVEKVIEVICCDVRSLALPERVDVVLAEMIDTWLLDEHQVPALNALRAASTIDAKTRVIPHRYEAFITFGELDFNCYGFKLPFPIHDWPDLGDDSGWYPLTFRAIAQTVKVFDADFNGLIDPEFEMAVSVLPTADGVINAVRLSGLAHLGERVSLRDTLAFNGNKILPIAEMPVTAGKAVTFRICGFRGGSKDRGVLAINRD
jgi:SAM-dependent methyltransferase